MILDLQFMIVFISLFLKEQRCEEIVYNTTINSRTHLPNPLSGLVASLLENGGQDIEEFANRNSYEAKLNLRTLRYISVMTRHGSRSPTSTYPTDPYPYTNIKYWPDGPGQLTRYGKQQLYATGQSLRMRYNGFLNVNYFPNDTLIRTNNYDRDFMSAACLLAGLYPPVGYQIWSPYILWQPIPIWPDNFDVAEVASVPTMCARFKQEQAKALEELDSRSHKYKHLLSYVSKHTEKEFTKISALMEVWDILQMQYENGYKLPQWTNKIYPKILAPVYAAGFATAIAGTPTMARLSAGPVLAMINNQLRKKSRGLMKPDRLMFIEAAHDATLSALLTALGVTTVTPIETSAFMIFELHENSAGHIVQILYYNNSAVLDPDVLDVPSCKNPCFLKDFSKLVSKIAPKNWHSECKMDDDY